MPVASSTVNSLLFRRLATGEKVIRDEEKDTGANAKGSYQRVCDSQFCCVLRDVIGYFGEFLV